MTPVHRRLALGVVAAPAGVAAGLALHLGWGRGFDGPVSRPWESATGWDRIAGAPPPETVVPAAGGEPVILHWLGHAGFLLEWHGNRLLLDPHLSARVTVSPRLLEMPPGLPRGAADLPPVDAALISHAHFDHLDLPTLEAVPALPRVLLPAGSEGYVERLAGVGLGVTGLAPGVSTAVGGLRVTAVPALHGGSRHHPLASRHRALGWVIEATGATVYFAGDTGYGPHFEAIGQRHRPAVAILPIGAFSPPFPIGRVHLSPEQAVRAALDLGWGGTPPRVVPCHFGTFVLSLDRAETALPRFARAADRAGVAWTMPALLGEGACSRW